MLGRIEEANVSHAFHPDFPVQCPPSEATEIDQEIYRGIPHPPITRDDFLSHVELEKSNADAKTCEHWGLSVWATKEEAENARGLHRYMRRWHIAKGKVKPSSGLFLPTPNEVHPEHCTFWKVFGLDLVNSFAIELPPLGGKK